MAAAGVADELVPGPLPVAELARRTGTHPRPLRRVLRALAARGVFEALGDDVYGLTPVGRLLCRDHRLSMHAAYQGSAVETRAWAALEHSLRTGRGAFEHVYGESHYSYRAVHRDEDARVDRIHMAATRVDAQTLVRVYPWASVGTVVDVGGGTGSLLAELLRRHRHLRGILFDLPHMVASAPPVLGPVADRCELVGGDFFVSVPAGADVYVLKTVLGAWDDDAAVRILRTIRTAMRADSELLVINPITGQGETMALGTVVNLASLVLYGQPDRTYDDVERLLEAAGLHVRRFIARPTLPVFVAAPAVA